MHRFILPVLVPLASAAVHTVQVGQSGLDFVPRTISAVEGDTVIFELFSAHDVVEGDFDSPCQTDDDDFYSGPYSDTDNGARKFVVNVTSNDPIYYYCSVQRHCQSGMVGGINIPNSGSETIDAYSQAAANVQQAETPNQLRGGQLLDDAQLASLTSSSSASASASASASSASSGASASATSTSSGSGSASQSASASAATATGGAAPVSSGQVSGVAAIVLGVAAWFI
ncbi:hypothetical protein C7974DRAFT_139282 [Boeremia exigua]|uniref:uncharacterized protein n=1 Tax=Boeremia exigua TaxID=749465 RepID=UPI001E8D0E25|nr:uncharacterized protein C7974DRAFT_139282 [Boeremia exigua]KAH6639820.1 hypothetical protein C7974DRAFT_139282 [Boeremia exigua]